MQPVPDFIPPQQSSEDKLREYQHNLVEMTKHPGWKIYVAWMKAQKEQLEQKYREEKDPNKLLRSAGAYAQACLVMDWPELQISAFTQQIKQAEAKRKQQQSLDPNE